MKKLIVASNNDHKVKEIKEMLKQFPLKVLSLKEADINIDIDETGSTFMENAYLKADAIHKFLGEDSMVLADDSGLMVDELNGAPGVYSARFAGEHGNYKKNNEKLKMLMKDKPEDKRSARFVCAMVLILDDKNKIEVQGEVEGTIIDLERGEEGFGYDPLFYIPKYNKTFAEMSPELKNEISHRGVALKKLENKIKDII